MRNTMQLAYVTEDIDAAAAFLETQFGTVDCVKSYRASLGGRVTVAGEPADEWVIDVALVNAGATNLEIIRPVSGAVDLYRDGVRPGVPATFHHIGFRIDDFDEASEIVARSGREWAQFGVSKGVRMGYLDLRAELGHDIEVMDLDDVGAAVFTHLESVSNAAR